MSWTYRPISTVRVNSTPPARKIAAKVATRLRSWNRSNGTTGFSALRSAIRKAMPNTAAAAPARNDRRAIASRLRGHGVDVVDARPEDLAPALADHYLAMKAAGKL
ncbi:membrane protein [Mycolicibacterium conceptionense]|uniref:Membrane protein n=1 Tax=Mycolicibacterium conceptionense TaxID=451644 RepID=A0A0U1DVZ3_9MYCO|nr:membrane protein [Mycolicibacterium conceptionense]